MMAVGRKSKDQIDHIICSFLPLPNQDVLKVAPVLFHTSLSRESFEGFVYQLPGKLRMSLQPTVW